MALPIALVAFASYGIGFSQLHAYVWGPSGKIFVGSPSVYTRERLVNDRYDEDYWLHKQLDNIDSEQAGYSLVTQSSTSATLNAQTGSGTEPKTDQGSANPGHEGTSQSAQTQPRQSFINNYTIRSAARDLIRQQVLENLLDDRHDLTGNSVYGLKFDTTVFPSGWAAAGRAFVRISIKPARPGFNGDNPVSIDSSGLGNYVEEFYHSSYPKIENDSNDPNHGPWDLYKRWQINLEWRLNLHLNQVLESKCNSRNLASQLSDLFPLGQLDGDIVSTVNSVLGIKDAAIQELSPATDVLPGVQPPLMGVYKTVRRLLNGASTSVKTTQTAILKRKILIPRKLNNRLNWPDFVGITVDEHASLNPCQAPPKFNVEQVLDTIELADPSDEYLAVDTAREPAAGPHDRAQDKWLSVRTPGSLSYEERVFDYWPHYKNIGVIANYLMTEYPAGLSTSPDGHRYFNVASGFFNFVDRVINVDMYAYSIFPRLDAYSTLKSEENAGALAVSGGGADSFDWRHSQAAIRASLETAAVGFTDSGKDQSIDFGWVIDVGAESGAVQKSQFALVSVPAWTERLHVRVSTGWLTWSSEEHDGSRYQFDVPIPPDFEAFDSFIAGREISRRPLIDNELMESKIELIACQKASIVIPGLRLWRSAMVTVGSERADRITVLPNMRGIIAEFTKLGYYAMDTEVPLRVWTSEGVDSWRKTVVIKKPEDPRQCADRPPTPDKPPPPPIQTGN